MATDILSSDDIPEIEFTAFDQNTIPFLGPTPVQRMLSACTGAVLTALIVTPFDVVKTRMQSEPVSNTAGRTHMKSASSEVNLNNLASSLSTRLKTFTVPARSGQSLAYNDSPVAGTLTKTSIPGVSSKRITGTLDGLRMIARSEGLRSLWTGLSPTLFASIPSTVVYYMGYEMLREQAELQLKDTSYYALSPLLAGAVARTTSATITSPIELLRTRMQSGNYGSSLIGVTLSLKTIMQTDGIRSLFRGLPATLARDVPFSAIYWMSYEKIKVYLIEESKIHNSRSTTSQDVVSIGQEFQSSFIAGAVAGSLAAVATNPFDVVKTIQQVEKPSCTKTSRPPLTTIQLLRHVYASRGISGMFCGLSPRLAKVAPACAVMISSYEVGKRFFKYWNQIERPETYISAKI